MRNNYVQELEALHNKLLGLGKAAETSVNKATQAYIESDTELAHEVFSDDLRINATTAEIEKDTHKIIALQQPVAQDLRMLFAVLHVSIDLERIADHAVSIGTIALRNQDHDEESQTVKGYLARMAQVAEKMIADAWTATSVVTLKRPVRWLSWTRKLMNCWRRSTAIQLSVWSANGS